MYISYENIWRTNIRNYVSPILLTLFVMTQPILSNGGKTSIEAYSLLYCFGMNPFIIGVELDNAKIEPHQQQYTKSCIHSLAAIAFQHYLIYFLRILHSS